MEAVPALADLEHPAVQALGGQIERVGVDRLPVHPHPALPDQPARLARGEVELRRDQGRQVHDPVLRAHVGDLDLVRQLALDVDPVEPRLGLRTGARAAETVDQPPRQLALGLVGMALGVEPLAEQQPVLAGTASGTLISFPNISSGGSLTAT